MWSIKFSEGTLKLLMCIKQDSLKTYHKRGKKAKEFYFEAGKGGENMQQTY